MTENLVREADLALTLTRAQRSTLVDLWPPAVRRAFTLHEFARLLEEIDVSNPPEGSPAARLWSAVPPAAAKRGLRRTAPKADDVLDPYRLSDEVYAASYAEIMAAVNVIVTTLVPKGGERFA